MCIIYFTLGLQTVKSPKVRDIGVQCSSAYTDTDICVEEVGVQCSLLVTPITLTPLKYHAQSDTSQSDTRRPRYFRVHALTRRYLTVNII